MSKLAFFARGSGRVYVPGTTHLVNRERVDSDSGIAYPASAEPFRCKPDTPVARRLAKLMRRDQSLWPADQYTADYCGVTFVPVELLDGEHVPAGDRSGSVSNSLGLEVD